MLGALYAVLLLGQQVAEPLTPTAAGAVDAGFHSPDLDLSYASLRVDPSNQVYLADHIGPVLYLLHASGDTASTLVRRGQGPGEAIQIRGMGWVHDSLWIIDGALQRITFLTKHGKVIATSRFEDRCRTPNPWAILSDGRCLMGQPPMPGRRDNAPMIVEASGGRGSPSDTILSLITANAYTRFNWDDGAVTLPQPFGDNPLLAIAPTSDFLVLASRDAAQSAEQARFSIRVWSVKAGWRPSRSFTYDPLPLSTRSRDSAVSALAALVVRQAPTSPVTVDSVRRRLFTPKYLPPLRSAMVARDSMIWLGMQDKRTSREGTDHRQYWLLDMEGNQRGTVSLPANATPLDAYGPYVWCIVLDNDDVPSIVRVRIPAIRPVKTR